MTATPDDPPMVRRDSPSPETTPSPALGVYPRFTRYASAASLVSHGSGTTNASNPRESLGSDISAFSRASSASYQSSRQSDISMLSRQSTGSFDAISNGGGGGGGGGGSSRQSVAGGAGANRRRGYMRPQGTDFAASARSRESVLSLGSIAHLQYYFARTGLLDGKGGQLARKRDQKGQTLDLSTLDASSFLMPRPAGSSDHDSSYASLGSSPDQGAYAGFGPGPRGSGSLMVESPVEEHHPSQHDDDFYSDEYDEPGPHMLPPTVSTYNYREKPLPKPPSIAELKADLTDALDAAARAMKEVKGKQESLLQPDSPIRGSSTTTTTTTTTTTSTTTITATPESSIPTQQEEPKEGTAGWYEIQGLHILDVMTLAIRAAKVYYTAHEQPDRLDALKSERALRSELLSVMDVLKRMATRGFAGGMREDESRTMDSWIAGLHALLAAEANAEAAERAERASWAWLTDASWAAAQHGGGIESEAGTPSVAREEAFLRSMLAGASDPVPGMAPLPAWTPIDRMAPRAASLLLPTPFLAALANGLRLVQLHNCAVRKSRRRFGAIPTFHTDTQKPYRAADNLRYWIKAAELRWEVLLKIDVLGLQYNSGPAVWLDFEDAILRWCRKVREEIASEVQN